MRIVMPGGTGQVGGFVARWLQSQGHSVQIIGRSVSDPALRWDARTLGDWADAIDGADAVIQLTGRSVNCRYNWPNLREMMNSRVDSALVVGQAIAQAQKPPAVWLQASTATIYPHTLGPALDEGAPVGQPTPGVPAYWSYSVNIARSWELALMRQPLPHTRRVAMRFGFAMSPDRGGVFDWLMWVVRRGLGGPFYSGNQFVSWVTDRDVAGAIGQMLADDRLEGPVNVTAPEPLTNQRFMAVLRQAAGVRVGLPVLPGMAEAGAWMLGTDVELMRKSRRAVPAKLLNAGFTFQDSCWEDAAPDLVRRWRNGEVLG
ncbi:MAG: epimerase [Myxococcota bacterium]